MKDNKCEIKYIHLFISDEDEVTLTLFVGTFDKLTKQEWNIINDYYRARTDVLRKAYSSKIREWGKSINIIEESGKKIIAFVIPNELTDEREIRQKLIRLIKIVETKYADQLDEFLYVSIREKLKESASSASRIYDERLGVFRITSFDHIVDKKIVSSVFQHCHSD